MTNANTSSKDPSTWFSAIAIMLEAGVLLGSAYFLTRRLWLPIGLHIGWNFTQGGVFGIAVSGHPSSGLLQAVLSGPTWLSGGAFGANLGANLAKFVTSPDHGTTA